MFFSMYYEIDSNLKITVDSKSIPDAETLVSIANEVQYTLCDTIGLNHSIEIVLTDDYQVMLKASQKFNKVNDAWGISSDGVLYPYDISIYVLSSLGVRFRSSKGRTRFNDRKHRFRTSKIFKKKFPKVAQDIDNFGVFRSAKWSLKFKAFDDRDKYITDELMKRDPTFKKICDEISDGLDALTEQFPYESHNFKKTQLVEHLPIYSEYTDNDLWNRTSENKKIAREIVYNHYDEFRPVFIKKYKNLMYDFLTQNNMLKFKQYI